MVDSVTSHIVLLGYMGSPPMAQPQLLTRLFLPMPQPPASASKHKFVYKLIFEAEYNFSIS